MLKPLIPGLVFAAASCFGANVTKLEWTKLPPLPPAAGQAKQPGVAGPFAGVHGDALIVAGGANFPDKLPWDGGAKVWWKDIWVLEGLSGTSPRWVNDRTFSLPRPLGYGISVDTPEGVIVAGGHDADQCYEQVYLLSWDGRARTLQRTELPSMPKALSFMAGALVGRTLFVAGGQTTMKNPVPSKSFWALDLSKRGAAMKWEVLPSWPGPARVLPVAAAQRGASGMEFFLFSGRVPEAGRPTKILSDAYAYDPAKKAWRELPPVGAGLPGVGAKGLSVMAGSATAVGESEILLFGGDRGELFLELEAHDLAITAARANLAKAAAEEQAVLNRQIEERLMAKRKIYDSHSGFAREVLAFDTKRNTWRSAGTTPQEIAPQVTTLAVKYRDAILLPSGEVKPGIRTPDVVRVVPQTK